MFIFVLTQINKHEHVMKRLFMFGIMVAMGVLGVSAQGIYDMSVTDGTGRQVPLSGYRGKVLLIVNSATHCGFTPQYKELEALYEKYRTEGLEILDFPCNQFGQQAQGSFQDIHRFCTTTYNIQFPQFEKIDVNGSAESPLYAWLKSRKGPDIKWNFTKFLVGRDGRVIARYEPADEMGRVEADIRLELNPVTSAIMARRSIRKYLDKPVEHEKLEAIVRCGINAPSGSNRQPWIVRVVEDRQLIADVTEVFKQENPEQVKRDPGFKNMFRNAPNLICICSPEGNGGWLDAGLLGGNMLLAAQSMGLGTCCLGGPVRFLKTSERAKFFLERLDIPDGYELHYIIAVGYPDEEPAARPRDASKVKFIR